MVDANTRKWDLRFMEIAKTVANWSSCFQQNRHVGAVITKDKRIMTTGYNGACSGVVSCAEKGECLRRKLNIPSGTRHELCYAVHAEHSDRTAAGFILDDGEKTYYVSGDTLYNYDVIDEVLELVEDGVDYAFVPINGKGNNMNAKDAADFAYEIDAKCAIPLHYGLFDDINPETFDFDDTLILEPYKAKEL